MISFDQALHQVLDLFSPLESEIIPLAQAGGRILARDVFSKRSQPPFTASAMDGYAVIASEAVAGARLKVIGASIAGGRFDGTVTPGTAVRIFTGAPVPPGADKILIQEDTTPLQGNIIVSEKIDAASYLRPAGADFPKGHGMTAPCLLTPARIALLAAMNIARVPVTRKPVIALIATGDELVAPGETPGPDQIISSNSFGLKALFEAHGASVRLLPIARDNENSLTQILSLTEGVDLIVSLGGVSVGDHDLVRQVAQKTGLKTAFYKVAMRPGKPLVAGRYIDTPMLGLPGNPVSSMVCGHVFILPAIKAMQGLGKAPPPLEIGILGCDISKNGPRSHFMRASLSIEGHQPICTPFNRQDSALLSVLSQADVLLLRQPEAPELQAGAEIKFLRL